MLSRVQLSDVGMMVVASILGLLSASGLLSDLFAQDPKAQPSTSTSRQLPKPDPVFEGRIGETYRDSAPSYPMPVKVPAGSPNVLVILLDDVGFGMCSTFGGPVCLPRVRRFLRR